jgi:hydroxymethylpyrimidine pyrophosphatase-like HAD family hydrolase
MVLSKVMDSLNFNVKTYMAELKSKLRLDDEAKPQPLSTNSTSNVNDKNEIIDSKNLTSSQPSSAEILENNRNKAVAVSQMSSHLSTDHLKNFRTVSDPRGAALDAMIMQKDNIELDSPLAHTTLINMLEEKLGLLPLEVDLDKHSNKLIPLMIDILKGSAEIVRVRPLSEKQDMEQGLGLLEEYLDAHAHEYSEDNVKFLKKVLNTKEFKQRFQDTMNVAKWQNAQIQSRAETAAQATPLSEIDQQIKDILTLGF